jgi:alpha-tubulin suppressor-like RCC1 family protein
MNVLHRSRRLTWLAGCAALASGLAATAVAAAPAADAQARASNPGINRNAVVSWGSNNIGELGDGTFTSRSAYGAVSGLGSGIVQVAAGSSFGLALRSDGTVWAWGSNGSGQLGDGTTTASQTTRAQVTGLSGVIAVAAGTDQSLALRSDGTVWAWGGDRYGQLGDGANSAAQPTPVQVIGLTGVVKIAAGGLFSLALRSDGTVWAWGYNAVGELGNGTGTDSNIPVQVTGLARVTAIAAGEGDSAMAIRTDPIRRDPIRGLPPTGGTSVWTWGSNDAGQLGDGTYSSHLVPERVTGIGAPGVAGIAVGDGFELALGTDGSVWGWGADSFGQLGIGPQLTTFTRPVQAIAAGSGIIQLAAGVTHALALRSNGTVLAWGKNSYGELGLGNTDPAGGPVQVSGLGGALQVTAGWEFTLALYDPPFVAE